MILSSVYYIITFLLFIAIGYFTPEIATSSLYLIIGFIIPPIITGLIVTWKHQLDISKSERWIFAAITSLLVTSSSLIIFALVLATDVGKELYMADINEAGISVTSLLAISMAFFFITYLFTNRIGYSIGSIIGKISS